MGLWFEQTSINTTWRGFHINITNHSFEVLEKMILKCFPINLYVKLGSAILAPPYPRGSWFEQNWIYTTWGWFRMSFIFPSPVVLEKKIFKDFFYIFLCKTWSAILAPSFPQGSSFERIYITWGWFQINITNHSFEVLDKKILKGFSIYPCVKLGSAILAPP